MGKVRAMVPIDGPLPPSMIEDSGTGGHDLLEAEVQVVATPASSIEASKTKQQQHKTKKKKKKKPAPSAALTTAEDMDASSDATPLSPATSKSRGRVPLDAPLKLKPPPLTEATSTNNNKEEQGEKKPMAKTTYPDVKLKGEEEPGKLVLTQGGLVYYPAADAVDGNKVKIGWKNVAKYQANSSEKKKALLRITHQNTKVYLLEFASRGDLKDVKQDIGRRVKAHQESKELSPLTRLEPAVLASSATSASATAAAAMAHDSFTSHTATMHDSTNLDDSITSYSRNSEANELRSLAQQMDYDDPTSKKRRPRSSSSQKQRSVVPSNPTPHITEQLLQQVPEAPVLQENAASASEKSKSRTNKRDAKLRHSAPTPKSNKVDLTDNDDGEENDNDNGYPVPSPPPRPRRHSTTDLRDHERPGAYMDNRIPINAPPLGRASRQRQSETNAASNVAAATTSSRDEILVEASLVSDPPTVQSNNNANTNPTTDVEAPKPSVLVDGDESGNDSWEEGSNDPPPVIVEAQQAKLTDFLRNHNLQCFIIGLICCIVLSVVIAVVAVVVVVTGNSGSGDDSNKATATTISPGLTQVETAPTITASPDTTPTPAPVSRGIPTGPPNAALAGTLGPTTAVVSLAQTQSPSARPTPAPTSRPSLRATSAPTMGPSFFDDDDGFDDDFFSPVTASPILSNNPAVQPSSSPASSSCSSTGISMDGTFTFTYNQVSFPEQLSSLTMTPALEDIGYQIGLWLGVQLISTWGGVPSFVPEEVTDVFTSWRYNSETFYYENIFEFSFRGTVGFENGCAPSYLEFNQALQNWDYWDLLISVNNAVQPIIYPLSTPAPTSFPFSGVWYNGIQQNV